MTIIHSVTLCACLSEPGITKIWTKIDPYYQRRKCSVENLLYEDITVRPMPIFVGVRWIGRIKWQRWKLPFLLLVVAISFEISNMRPTLLSEYVYRHRNRWPWMTLNSHFALNTTCIFRMESFSVDALVLRRSCSKIDSDVHILSAAKM